MHLKKRMVNNLKVFINPGHAPNGIPDCGAVNPMTGHRESDINYQAGLLLEKYLHQAGLECKVLQSDSLSEICEESNAFDADLFVSIHCNAFNSVARGTETLYKSDRGLRLANCIQSQIINNVPNTIDRGVKLRNDLYVLNSTDAVAVLVELAFIDNTDDLYILTNHLEELMMAVARGITDY